MSTPELQKKKAARASAWAKAAGDAAKKADSDKAANLKAFAARAKSYEAEYAKVSDFIESLLDFECLNAKMASNYRFLLFL
jgi:predicted ArsR family transcriptional regulator